MKPRLSSHALTLFPLLASGLLFVQAAQADNIVSGSATVSFNNSALGASNPYGFYVANTYDASANSTSLYVSPAPAGGVSWGASDTATLNLAINSNTVTSWDSSDDRSLQATTFDPSTLSGQIGLSGALYLLTPTYGANFYLTAFDFDVVDQNGAWLLQSNDAAFNPSNPTLGFLQLTGVSESYANGLFSLNGNLIWQSGGDWSGMISADSTTTIGSISLTAQAVPLPSAVWLFGSALAGLGMTRCRRKS